MTISVALAISETTRLGSALFTLPKCYCPTTMETRSQTADAETPKTLGCPVLTQGPIP